MDKLLKMLGVEKLDESNQTQIKDKLDTLIEMKATELSDSRLSEEKDKLVGEYEDKFDEYKDDITSKFSNFVDSVLDEEMTIPAEVLEFAKKGELYHDLIEQFKTRLSVDEGLLDEEVKGILKEAKDKIIELEGQVNKITESNLELKVDAQELAASLYIREKCDGLTEAQKAQVLPVLEGITDREEIDKKFNLIVEMSKLDEEDDDDKKKKKDDDDEDEDDDKKKKKDDDDDEDEDEDDDKKKKDEGRGFKEVGKKKKKIDESTDGPFAEFLNSYVDVLKKNRI